MASPAGKTLLAAGASLAGAIGSALCCAGPLVAVFLGWSGAGLATRFEPFRPYFVAGTVLSLWAGFVVLHREERSACAPGRLCASPGVRRRMRWALWSTMAIAIPLLTFPWWSKVVLG